MPTVLAVLGTITSQTLLITALLYYFGWVRTQATLDHFGVSTGLIGYSTPDYVLRSVNVAFPPAIRVAFAALILMTLHRLVVEPALQRPGRERVARRLMTAGYAVAVAAAAVVVIGVLVPAQVGLPLGLALPLLLIGSVSLLGYLAHLRSAYPAALAAAPQPPTERGPPQPRGRSLVLLTLGLLGALWAVSLYGDQVGRRVATDIVADLPDRSAVVLYSVERIAVAGTGVQVADITQPGSKYRYQYSGIRLLVRSADKYLLLPVGWQRGRDRVFILRDDDSIRIDIAAR